MLGLCCCRLFCSGSNRGILSSWGAQTSHCSGFSRGRAWAVGCVDFSSCSSWALEQRLNSCSTCGMGDLLGLGIEHVSPVLAGRFFTTEPPGKPPRLLKEERNEFWRQISSSLVMTGQTQAQGMLTWRKRSLSIITA